MGMSKIDKKKKYGKIKIRKYTDSYKIDYKKEIENRRLEAKKVD
jgi:hypothetical protein